MAELERINSELTSSRADLGSADMETSEHLEITSNEDTLMENQLLNGNADISARANSQSGNGTIKDGGSEFQSNPEFISERKKKRRKNQKKRQNPLENIVTDHGLPEDTSVKTSSLQDTSVKTASLEDTSVKTASLERNSNVGSTGDANLSTGLPMIQSDSGISPLPGKKKKKRRKKQPNVSECDDRHQDHQEGTSSVKNSPIGTDLLPQPSVTTPLKAESKMINYDAEASLYQATDKGKKEKETHNPVEINSSSHIQKGVKRPSMDMSDTQCPNNVNANSALDVAEKLNGLPDCSDTGSRKAREFDSGIGSVSGRNKRRCRKKSNAKSSNHIHDDHQEGTSSRKNTPTETELLLQPSVCTPLKAELEMVSYDADASLYQVENKGKEMHNPVEINSSLDIQEGDGRPNMGIVDTKYHQDVDVTSASEVADELNGVPDCVDTCSGKELDIQVEDDLIPIEVNGVKKYKRKKQARKHARKKDKVSDSTENNLDTFEEPSGSSMSSLLVVENKVGDHSFGCSKEALPSCCPENMLEKEVLAGQGTSFQVVECISADKSSSPCSDSQPTPEEGKKMIEMGTSRQATNEDNFPKDHPVVDNSEGDLQPEIQSKIEYVNSSIQLGAKKEEVNYANSSIQLGAKKEEVNSVIVKENHPPLPLHHSPERALASRLRRKLLILDVNGLLVDIVSYASDGYEYEPETIIGRKALFKRAFCDSFLQFCFERFNVGVWSSRTKRNVDLVLDFLMGKSKHNLLFCWDQSHCTETGENTIENREKPLLLKELRKLWEKHDPNLPWERGDYNESNTLLLDDSPYKALLNPPNTAIFPRSYCYKDVYDTSLGPRGDLRGYLERLASSDNVQNFIEKNPFGQRPITQRNVSWTFYHKVITAVSSQPEGKHPNQKANSCDSSACR